MQYWKDRYLSQQQQLKRSALNSTAQPLNGWPDNLPDELPDELPDDMPIAHPATENSSDESLPAPRLPTVDLPEFLVRRRGSKADLPARVR